MIISSVCDCFWVLLHFFLWSLGLIKPKHECEGNTPIRQQFLFWILFKQMAVACSIFTLGGQVQLFWTAFDLHMTVVPLKVALGLEKFDFWAFQKNNWKNSLGYTCVIIFWNAQKSIFPILKPLLMVPLSQADQKLPKTIETPQLKWILGQLLMIFWSVGPFCYMVYGIWYVVYGMKTAFTVYSHMFCMCRPQAVYNVVHLFLVII